jgi:hypothetical protein
VAVRVRVRMAVAVEWSSSRVKTGRKVRVTRMRKNQVCEKQQEGENGEGGGEELGKARSD